MKELPNEQQLFYSKDGSAWRASTSGSRWPDEKCDGYLYKHLTWIEFQAILRDSIDLDAYKEDKKNHLRSSCRSQIVNLFISDALGSNHNYDCREEDQANIVTRTKASEIDGLDKKVWAHDGVEFTRVPHNTAQLQQLIVDMEFHIEESQSKLELLVSQVSACSSADDIDAISW